MSGVGERLRRKVARIVPGVALAQLTPAELEKLYDPRLRVIAVDHQPETDGGALVVGPTGVGKSAAIACLARRLILQWRAPEIDRWPPREAEPPVRVAAARDIAKARREAPLGGEPELLQRANWCSVLLIDDLGWETDPADVLGVIASRYDAGKPTVVTSGLTLQEFGDRYGAAVLRRIIEAGGKKGRVVNLFGKVAARAG